MATTRCIAVVDLPEPPFSLPVTMTWAMRGRVSGAAGLLGGGARGGGGRSAGRRRPVGETRRARRRGGREMRPSEGGARGGASRASELEAAELLVEARDAAAGVHQAGAAARPGGMDGGVDVEGDAVALGPVGGLHRDGRPVDELHLDEVIVGMDVLLHGSILCSGPVGAGRRGGEIKTSCRRRRNRGGRAARIARIAGGGKRRPTGRPASGPCRRSLRGHRPDAGRWPRRDLRHGPLAAYAGSAPRRTL